MGIKFAVMIDLGLKQRTVNIELISCSYVVVVCRCLCRK